MKYIITTLLLITNLLPAHAAQVCRTETEVPSTTPDSRFTDNNDGTISDKGTGLMWQKCPLGLSGSDCSIGTTTAHKWQQALDAAQNSTVAGYSDWRLPNHKELLSIIEHRCARPAININYFPNTFAKIPPSTTPSAFFWSSSPYADDANFSWLVDFEVGFSSGFDRNTGSLKVRLVRFEQ